MRVTQNYFADSLVSRLNTLTSRQYSLQNQVSSGLRVQAPEDDPVAMQDVLNYKTDKATQEQYKSNVSTLQDRANSIYSVLKSLQSISNRIGEIATIAGDPTKSASDLNNYATETNQLIEQAASLVNTKDATTGQYLFAGTNSGQAPFTITRDSSGNITAVTYQGNTSVNQIPIADGATLSVDVPGSNTSGSGVRGLITDSGSGADLFNHLVTFKNDLISGNKTAIATTDSQALKADESNILYQVSYNGAAQTRLTSASSLADDSVSSLDKMISHAADADLVETMVQLNQAQNSYQAALASGSKIMQLSLLNYIQ